MSEDIKYGCINEDEFCLQSPRMIEGDECDTIAGAFEEAQRRIEDENVETISICRCKYYGDDGNGYWGEIPGDGQISIDACDVEWACADADAEVEVED